MFSTDTVRGTLELGNLCVCEVTKKKKKYYTRAQQQEQQQQPQPQKLVLEMAANSCSPTAADGRAKNDDDRGRDHCNSNSNSCSEEAAVEKREWSGEQLVALKPGHHIGPYRLQVRLFQPQHTCYSQTVAHALTCPPRLPFPFFYKARNIY